MNIKIPSINSKVKYLLYILIIVIVIVLLDIVQSSNLNQKISTVPLIPTVTPTDYSKPIPTPTEVFISQKLVFDWGTIKPTIPESVVNYSIRQPLISSTTIFGLSEIFGFSSSDKKQSTKNTSFIWANNTASLFASTDQNQIIYQKKGDMPPHSKIIQKDEAISTSLNILSTLFGKDFLQTLAPNPSVHYLKPQLSGYSPLVTNDPEVSQTIEVSFKQNINEFPVISLSGSADMLSVVIDTNNNLFRLSVFGGFYSLSTGNTASLIDFETLKATAQQKAQKITAIKNVSYESLYSTTPQINIKVKDLSLSYFQRNDNTLYPVFLINGTATGKNLPNIEATYLVPAIKN